MEFGIFSDEGLLEGGFTTGTEACRKMILEYGDEPNVAVFEICPDHEEHAREFCEMCAALDEEDAQD